MPGPSSDQLSLFESTSQPTTTRVRPARVPEDLAAVGAALPAGLFLGTSSWSFPGWQGFVWASSSRGTGHTNTVLAREGLAAYAAHPLLTAVGIDRTYYQPLTVDDFAAYRAQIPSSSTGGPDFRFLVKAHEALTVARWPEHERYGHRQGQKSSHFLDAAYAAEAVIGPTREGLGALAGPLVFQFAPQDVGRPLAFIERLHAFLDALPHNKLKGHEDGLVYAVEVRNRELLRPQYALALADAAAVPCFNVHSRMPSVEEQWRAVGEVAWAEGGPLVGRWMLKPGLGYEEARQRYQPFNRLADPDPGRRREWASLARFALAEGREVVITVNNKAEGSAPLSVFELARAVVDGPSRPG